MANFVLNPYLGNVNQGTTDGLKLYNKAIEAPETKIDLDQKNARDIHHFLLKMQVILDGVQELVRFKLIMQSPSLFETYLLILATLLLSI